MLHYDVGTTGRCDFCGVEVSSKSALCMRCYAAHLQPCSQCQRRDRNGDLYRVKHYKGPHALHCAVCDGYGWVLAPYPKANGADAHPDGGAVGPTGDAAEQGSG